MQKTEHAMWRAECETQKVEHEARFRIQSVVVKCYWKHEQQSGKLKQQSAILKQQSGKHETQTSKWEAQITKCDT